MSDLAIAFTDGSEPELSSAPPTLVSVPAPAAAAAPAPAPPAAPQQPPVQTVAPVATFEGAQVGMKEIKISGQASIEAGDITVSMDDLVRAVGVYRVVGVRFYVHPKTGETVRQMVIKPVETLVVVPFDSSNPNDDGIVRARPVTP